MQCPACSYAYTFREAFLIFNPFRTRCPSCKIELTAGRPGVVLNVILCAVGIGLAWYLGRFYHTGDLTLAAYSAAVFGYLVIVLPIVDYVAFRVMRLQPRRRIPS